jgi:hypothetical protein
VAGVDGVALLALEAVQLLLLVGAQRSYPDLVHGPVSTSLMLAHLGVETVLIPVRLLK